MTKPENRLVQQLTQTVARQSLQHMQLMLDENGATVYVMDWLATFDSHRQTEQTADYCYRRSRCLSVRPLFLCLSLKFKLTLNRLKTLSYVKSRMESQIARNPSTTVYSC